MKEEIERKMKLWKKGARMGRELEEEKKLEEEIDGKEGRS